MLTENIALSAAANKLSGRLSIGTCIVCCPIGTPTWMSNGKVKKLTITVTHGLDIETVCVIVATKIIGCIQGVSKPWSINNTKPPIRCTNTACCNMEI
jgi:hypothetical protein